jgi:hypothetical protein
VTHCLVAQQHRYAQFLLRKVASHLSVVLPLGRSDRDFDNPKRCDTQVHWGIIECRHVIESALRAHFHVLCGRLLLSLPRLSFVIGQCLGWYIAYQYFGGRFWLHSLSTATIRQISRFGGAFYPDHLGTRFPRNDCMYRITRHPIHYHRDIYFHHRENLNLKDRSID